MRNRALALLLNLCCLGALAQSYSYPAQTFTATNQTGATINLVGGSAPTAPASGTITVAGTITTVTWVVKGSSDGGANWFTVPTASVLTPGTLAASETTTTPSLYIINLAGLTNLQFITSGTFTATNPTFKLVSTSAPGLLSRAGGTSSGGGTTTNSATFAKSGGAAPGTNFNGSSPVTISPATIAALPSEGDASATPSLVDFITSTNATGTITSPASHALSTAGITSAYVCTVYRVFASGSNYRGTAVCSDTSGGYLFIYRSGAAAVGSESWTGPFMTFDSGSNMAIAGQMNAPAFQASGQVVSTRSSGAGFHETLFTPATSSATCTTGDFADDANYHYVCTATNTWKRVALSAF